MTAPKSPRFEGLRGGADRSKLHDRADLPHLTVQRRFGALASHSRISRVLPTPAGPAMTAP